MRVESAKSADNSKSSATGPKSLINIQENAFGFHSKTTYDATEALLQARSEKLKFQPDIKDEDVWKRQPPDFRYIVYEPTPPKRNTTDSMKPWQYDDLIEHRDVHSTKESNAYLPQIDNLKKRKPDIVTRFHIDRPFTAKKKFVSFGMFKPGLYKNPKPHDFRQYPAIESLGLKEFETDWERDPYNLKFRSQKLNQIHGLSNQPTQRDLLEGRQMAPPISAKPYWERRLILDKDAWPNRSAAYTRHRRRNRQPYSAFMELVERHLTARWYQEKLDNFFKNSQ